MVLKFCTFSKFHFFLAAIIVLTISSGCVPADKGINSATLLSSISGSDGDSGVFSGLLTAQTLTATKVGLTWTASNDPSVVAYNVYDTTLITQPKLIKSVRAPANSVSITNLIAQNYYSFRVRALMIDGKEDSNTVDIGAIPYGGILSANVVSATTANVTFSDGSNSDKIKIYCKIGVTAVTETLVATVSNVLNTTTAVTNLISGELYTCRAVLNIGGFEDNNTMTVSFIPLGQATKLVYTTQPSSSTAGVVLPGQPVISIQDNNGNVISAGPDSNSQVTLSISTASPSLGTVRGTATVTAVKGVATFTGINFQEAGLKILTASKADTSSQVNGSGILTADSDTFTISPGSVNIALSSISITPSVPPANALVADGNAAYTVTITLKDQYSNPIAGIKPQFASSLAGDTIVQPQTNTDASGQSSGVISSIVADEVAPFRVLSVSSPSGLSALTTLAPFVAGGATKLGFTVQPSNSPGGLNGLPTIKVAVQDANGNTVVNGAASTSSIVLSIASNVGGAVLSGTKTVTAIAGVATFTGLGIDKTGIGYKLLASSGTLAPAYSNSFNVTAGVPQKITITGMQSVTSGSCSASISVQLQDSGGNPANALQNTPLTISGLGSASLYSSSSCSGTALTATLTFTAGTNTKTLYLKDLASETITLNIRDTSSVLTTGTRDIAINPSRIKMAAYMPSPPAAAGVAMSVVAGVCSPAIVITPTGENNNAGPLSVVTNIAITGIAGTSAVLYSDSSCTNALTATSIPLPITAGTGAANYPINIYVKDLKSETLNLNISDPALVMTTMSATQSIAILPSNLSFTGPTTVVAGQCSTVFTIKLKDAAGNSIAASSNTSLTINGLATSTTGKFYTNSACTGTGSNSTLTMPSGSSTLTVYFSDTTAEALNIFISDPAGLMANSPTISISISPAAFKITGPTPANAKTTACAGPFLVNTMDGATTPNVTAAIGTITANLSHSGYGVGFTDAGSFYSDSGCTNTITTLVYSTGDSAKNFYFKSNYPITTLTLKAADAATVLADGTMAWSVVANRGWLGTLGKMFDAVGDLIWFRTGAQPVSTRQNGPRSIRSLHFDATKQYLYVVDQIGGKIVKYDYLNKKYIGWIGWFWNANNATAPMTGSNQATYPNLPSPAACIATQHWNPTPGWCLGGQSANVSGQGLGGLWSPQYVTDDGTYLYVTNYSDQSVVRFDAESGAFKGWIGGVQTTPTGAATGGPASCSTTNSGPTPGWCVGGAVAQNQANTNTWGYGNGALRDPRAIANDGTYLYVSHAAAIFRYNLSSGAFAGWIGRGYTTAPTGGAAGCTTLANGATTPGWCMGGTFALPGSRAQIQAGGVYYPSGFTIDSGILYVSTDGYGGVITKYNLSTGAFISVLPSLAYNFSGSHSIARDSTSGNIYLADSSRVITLDSTGLLIGWIGKVGSNTGLSSAIGNTVDCSTLSVSANTPGWCLGGSAKAGIDENSFEETYALELDGAGNILVGQLQNPSIKIFDVNTGAYGGSLVASSSAPTSWSTNATAVAEIYGFGDGDYYSPSGAYNDGTYLYVADRRNGRVKKMSLSTGALIGWVGGSTTVPTGGASASCLTMNPMSVTPGWCLGSLPNPWDGTGINYINSSTMSGLMYNPSGITGDGTYIYVTDSGWNRVNKFNAATGAFVGWIGKISVVPSGGAAGCTTAAVNGPTPGWCTGGTPTNGNGDGMFDRPTGITYVASTGNIYVVDNNNHRVSSFNASTGAFVGWIGRTNAAPSSGCTPASNGGYTVSATGWCKGGTSQAGSCPGDRGGGFCFWGGYQDLAGIVSDGTYLYVANNRNYRIDKFTLTGVWSGGVLPSKGTFTNTWSNVPATVGAWNTGGCDQPRNIWTDGTNMYGVNSNDCQNWTGGTPFVWKMNLSSGNVIGWQGGILPGNSPSNGDAGCSGATNVTPGWCQGGASLISYKMGQFSELRGITGDGYYLYLTDEDTMRVTRLPK